MAVFVFLKLASFVARHISEL